MSVAKKGKTGAKLSSETRRKMSEAAIGRPKSQAHRAALAEAGRIDGVTWAHGRAYVFAPTHPAANGRGRVKRARLVVEAKLGRFLGRHEAAHHINLDPADDDPENLMRMVRTDHMRFHQRIRALGIEDSFRNWFSQAERESADRLATGG